MIKNISNIDTIYILVDIENYDNSCQKLLDYLQNEKELSISANKEMNNYKHIITLNEITFELLQTGCKGYSFILKNDGFEVKVSKYQSKIKNFSPLQIRISSEYLWSYGIKTSWNIISNWITNTFGNIISNKVCRLDLCTHVSGMDFITNYEYCYKGHFKKYDKTFHFGNSINSITFGSRKGKNIYCRIYNKTLEIKETKKKYWFFDIWNEHGLDIDNVWNLEFELKSEFLRSMKILSIEDTLSNISNLWFYCTSEWLIRVDRTNKRIDRCPINQSWLELQKAFGDFNNNNFIKREKQISLDATGLIPNIIGTITSYSARINQNNINDAFKKLYNDSIKYLLNKNTTFEDEVYRKYKILHEKENMYE